MLICMQIRRPNCLRNFGLAVQESYSEKMFWWSGVELGRRLVIIFLASVTIINAVELFCITTICTFSIALDGFLYYVHVELIIH